MEIGFISHADCALHVMDPSHPESPARLKAIKKAIDNSEIKDKLKFFEAPLATKQQLARAHAQTYVDFIFQVAPQNGIVMLDPDTSMGNHSLQAALRAAGSVVLAVDLVLSKQISAAFCSVRPPGHHAEKGKAMGFCFFNNIAVGVVHALEEHQLKRVAIVDFDVHHGNGTENIFQNDERVLLCSSFQHPFYPYSGTENKSANVLSIPLAANTSGKEFREAVERYWLEQIKEFNPDIIFFSAGFDAHEADQLANLRLHEEDYTWLTKKIKNIADECCEGRIVSVLEGGYALNALGASVVAHLSGLLSLS